MLDFEKRTACLFFETLIHSEKYNLKQKGRIIMNKEKMLQIAERNLKKAKMSLLNNYERKGVTEQELENLSNNVEYAQIVHDMILERAI